MHLQNEITYRFIEIPEIHIEFQFSDYVIALKTKEVLFYTQVRVLLLELNHRPQSYSSV